MRNKEDKRQNKQKDVDMTQGSISQLLINFSIPLLLGNLFQQLYNTVDTWTVGNFASNEAFSAVGTVGPIINMLIGAFTGLATGAGVVISQYYGAKKMDKLKESVHTAIALTVALSIAFSLIGYFMTPAMLRMMKTPAEVFPESKLYLEILFAFMTGTLFYNMGSGILRAVGDSRRPFYYLLIAAGVNVVLDLLFVIKFHMGVAGVAWATVISQFASAIFTMRALIKTDLPIKINVKEIRFHGDILRKIIFVGFPAALQMAITAFSNVFVQGYINFFGADCMGGWTAYAKIDQLLFLPMQSISHATTTFVGQNLGKGQVERAKKGVKTSLMLAMGVTLTIELILFVFAAPMVRFFNDKPEVVQYGTLFLKLQIPFYVLCCLNQIYAAALRGSGNSKIPMLVMLGSFVAFRQIYLYVVSNFISNTIIPVAMGYPAGWLLCSALMLICYKRADFSKNKLLEG